MSALSGAFGIADGMRHVLHDGLERLAHAHAGLAAREHGFIGRNREAFLDLVTDALGIGGRQVDLVDERDDLQVRVHRQVRVGDRLRLDALSCVDDEQHALARCERARDLVGEVDVSGGVDQVELVRLTIIGLVHQRARPAP